MRALHADVVLKHRCWCPLSLVLVLLIILLPMSFQNVEYYEVAFVKRRTTGTISRDKVYYPGRHCVGPDAEFVKFPASEQTVDFKGMSVWTKTERVSSDNAGAAGTAINLDVTFQFKLRPDELAQLYASVGLNYRPFIENLATTMIKNMSTSFTAEEWTKDRAAIQLAMTNAVDEALNRANADCVLLQVRKIIFPPTYIERMLAAAVQIQVDIRKHQLHSKFTLER
jgi:regulator of protease activity HflC (stomatin/prohibitin superfamily)